MGAGRWCNSRGRGMTTIRSGRRMEAGSRFCPIATAARPARKRPIKRCLMTNEYRSRITTPEKALSVVKSGQRVYVHNGCAEPEILVSALVQRASELHDVQILHMATFGRADYTAPRYAGHFRLQSLFLGARSE